MPTSPARIRWHLLPFTPILSFMKPSSITHPAFLWHPSSSPSPACGKTHTGTAQTLFGTMLLVWTDDFLLEAGFGKPNHNLPPCPTAPRLADLIVSHSPLPLRPLAIGTPFQLQVWQALTLIPYGTTTSYREIALTIGSPKASRAVGSAIGANRLALLIPCHRVIRSNGDLGGFGWGLPTKQKILTHEHP